MTNISVFCSFIGHYEGPSWEYQMFLLKYKISQATEIKNKASKYRPIDIFSANSHISGQQMQKYIYSIILSIYYIKCIK